MKHFTFLMIILFFPLYNTFSFEKDYSIQGVVRSFPVGASSLSTFGIGKKFWEGDSEPMYGYLRGSALAQSSVLINGIGAQVDFFPISFLGFYAGSKYLVRSTKDLATFDCSIVKCDGAMTRNYFGAKLGLAYQKIFFLLDGKIEQVDMKNRTGVFAEETGTLLGASGGDQLTQVTWVLGYELTKSLSLGTLMQLSQMKKLKNNTSMNLGIARYTHEDWTFLFGVGQFHTRSPSDHLTVLGMINWTGKKGVQLL